MSLLREIIDGSNVFAEGNLPSRNVGQDHFITPEGMVGDTTSNEYMPYLSAFRGMSELVEYGERRALIYKMLFYQYNSIYSKRARGVNRDFGAVLDVFRRGGKTYLLNGDVGCEIYAGTILQRVLFDAFGNRQEGWDLLIMLGVKPEHVFNGGISGPVDMRQFCLFVDSRLLDNICYAKMYKKFSEMIIVPLIQYGIRVVFTPSIIEELFKVKRYVPQFNSTGALVDYKRSFNDCIDLGETVNVDYRYPSAIRHETVPGNSEEEVSLPGIDGQPFQVTLNAADFESDFVPEERPPLRVTIDAGAIPQAVSMESHTYTHGEWVNTRAAVPSLEIIGLNDELPPEDRVVDLPF